MYIRNFMTNRIAIISYLCCTTPVISRLTCNTNSFLVYYGQMLLIAGVNLLNY